MKTTVEFQCLQQLLGRVIIWVKQFVEVVQKRDTSKFEA